VNLLDRIEAGLDAVVAAGRRRSRIFDRLWLGGTRYMEVDGGRLAAAIAYYAFFAVFALALLAYSILGFLLQYDLDVFAAVDDFLKQNLPWLQPATIQGSRGKVGLIGLAGLVVTGVGWIEAIRSSIRLIFALEEHPGHPVIRRLLDLAVLVGLLVLLGASLTLAYGVEQFLEWLAGGQSTPLAIVGWVLSILVNMVLAAALLGGVPRVRLPVRRQVSPVLLVGLGITLLNTAGRFVISAVRDNPAYSVVAGAVGLLLYLYIFNQLLLFGAALVATSPHGRVIDLAGRRI
jgi:membrane protein